VIHADSLRLTPEDAAEQMYARMRRDMREAGLAAERRLRALERFVEEVTTLAEKEWRYKGEFGWGAWQEGEGPDPEGWALDHAAAQIRDAHNRLREATS
jgi:hypothetical protein